MSFDEGGEGGANVQDKNTSARLCTKNAEGAYAHLRDTTETKSYAEAHDAVVSKLFMQDVLGD